MLATESDTPNGLQPDHIVATRGGSELADLRGTRRGKTHLSLAELEAKVAHYPEEARTATRAVQAFFVAHCGSDIERLRALAQDKLKVRRSPEYFSNWIKGYYFRSGGGNVKEQGLSEWTTFCETLQEHDRMTTASGKLGIVETGTSRAIENHVREILDVSAPCRFAGISGPTGSQKTESLKLLSLKLGGYPRAIRFECKSRWSLGAFQRKWANAYNAKLGNTGGSALEEYLEAELRPDRVVIIHNIQRALIPGKKIQPIFEYLIEVQEEHRFPLVLEFKENFLEEQSLSDWDRAYFEQIIGRMGGYQNILRLPAYTPVGDLRAIARAYNLHDGDQALAYLKAWAKEPGRIRIVFGRLHRARLFAKADGKDRITLELLKAVNDYVPPFVAGDDEGGAS